MVDLSIKVDMCTESDVTVVVPVVVLSCKEDCDVNNTKVELEMSLVVL